MLTGYGLPARSPAEVARHLGHGPRELVAGVYADLGLEPGSRRLEADTARYLAACAAEPVRDSVLFGDAADAIRGLATRGVPVGVCTNRVTGSAWAVLRHFRLAEYVVAVVGAIAPPPASRTPRTAATPTCRRIPEFRAVLDEVDLRVPPTHHAQHQGAHG